MTETILAPNTNRPSLKRMGKTLEENYKLDECIRLSLQVPKFQYSRNILPNKFAKELANKSPRIAGITGGMPIQLAYKIIETSLEAVVTKLKANQAF